MDGLRIAALALAMWGVFACVMMFGWATAMRTGNNGWVDVCWTFAVGFVGIASAFVPVFYAGHFFAIGGTAKSPVPASAVSDSTVARAALCATMVGLWSLRLGLHIARRSARGKDDPRYAQLRKEWGRHWPSYLFMFLQIQALAGVPLTVAIMVAASRVAPFGDWRDCLAVAVFVVALFGESMSDRALRRFSQTTDAGQSVCDIGPWRWSRHPNYVFECLAWCLWPVMAFAPLQNPWSALTLCAPLLMYWLLVHVSGIPPLEAHMARSRGQVWHDYAARTPAFFPRFSTFRALRASHRNAGSSSKGQRP